MISFPFGQQLILHVSTVLFVVIKQYQFQLLAFSIPLFQCRIYDLNLGGTCFYWE